MPPYDEDHRVTIQPIKATFAGALLGTTADKTATSADVGYRLQFFRAIKAKAFACMPEVAPDAGAHVTSQTFQPILTDGTTVFARATLGTVAGVMATGSIINASIAANKELYVAMALSDQDGTVQTFAPGAVWSILEYAERL